MPPGPSPDPETVKLARRLRAEGWTDARIAKLVGVHPSSIYHWLGKKGRDTRRYDNSHYHYRAMYLRECGYTITEIAEQMGVPRSTVGDWIKGFGCYGRPTT